MIDKFCEAFLLKVRRQQKSYGECLATGSMKSMEDYKNLCGKIQGLDESQELLKQTFNEFFGETKPSNREVIDD